jgi:hypothetical protein
MQERWGTLIISAWSTTDGLTCWAWNLQCKEALLLPGAMPVSLVISIRCCCGNDDRGNTRQDLVYILHDLFSLGFEYQRVLANQIIPGLNVPASVRSPLPA